MDPSNGLVIIVPPPVLRAGSLTAAQAFPTHNRQPNPCPFVSCRSAPPRSPATRQNDARQHFSRTGWSMVLADARRLLTAAMFVHLLASANASISLRLAPFCLLHLNVRPLMAHVLFHRPAAPRSPISCTSTRTHLADRTHLPRGPLRVATQPVQVGPAAHSTTSDAIVTRAMPRARPGTTPMLLPC